MADANNDGGFPRGVAAPARRALASAGYHRLEDLNGASEAKLAKLHGMGPNALTALGEALAANGMRLAD